MKTYQRRLVIVPRGTSVSDYEITHNVIVLSAKDCGKTYEFWVI